MRIRFGGSVPTILGVLALAGIGVITIVRLDRQREPGAGAAGPQPAFSLGGTLSGPQVPVSLLPAEPSPAARRLEATRVPQPSTGESVAGHYRVVESQPDGFVGELTLSNETGAEQGWVVTVSYPGDLRASSLDPLLPATPARRGDTFTWTSPAPLAAGATARLRVHFTRAAGDTLTGCAVNGSPCLVDPVGQVGGVTRSAHVDLTQSPR